MPVRILIFKKNIICWVLESAGKIPNIE